MCVCMYVRTYVCMYVYVLIYLFVYKISKLEYTEEI